MQLLTTNRYRYTLLIVFQLCNVFLSQAQTIWTGPKLYFEKLDSADWTLEENQDRITDNVWITRQNNRGIFNIKKEDFSDRTNRTSPNGTEWANGSTADGIENLTFTSWHSSKFGSSVDEVGKPKVMHLIEEDIYIDVVFRSWTAGGGGSGTGFGGGFAYERSTPISTSVHAMVPNDLYQIFTTAGMLHVQGNRNIISLEVLNLQGVSLRNASYEYRKSVALNISDLPNGVYIVRINSHSFLRYFL